MANLQEKGRMSLKDGKKGDGERNERIAVGSGARERRGVSAKRGEGDGGVVVRAGWLREGKGGARPVGRYFCACFVFNFSPPFARRGADAAPRRAAPRRRAEEPWRWLVCGCLSSYAYLSASHIDSGRHYAS